MNEHHALAIQALSIMKGDNLARARINFKNYTPAQMQEQFGLSGKTRAQVLADYEAHDAKIEKAISWIRGLK